MTRRVAVFLPNWVGDAAMATPTLRALRVRFGAGAEIIGIMRPRIEEVLAGTRWIDTVWHYDPAGADPRGRWPALVRRLRAAAVDLSIHLTNDFQSVLAARLGGARRRAGYARNGRGWLLTTRLDPPRRGRLLLPIPAPDYYLALAHALGCADASPRLELATTAGDEAAADQAWAALGLAPGEAPVIINSSGAFGSAKRWPERHCAALAERVAGELGLPVVILCGPAEREGAARIAAAAAHPQVASLAGLPLSIGLSKACVRRARCLVSTDSGPRHFGAAFGVPVVALFGPTDPAWTDTRHPGEARLAHPVRCAPCGQRECALRHHACMEELSVADVFRAVARAVAGGDASGPTPPAPQHATARGAAA
jgi:heptosyltransferase-2